MKRILAFAVVFVMLISSVGCTKKQDEPDDAVIVDNDTDAEATDKSETDKAQKEEQSEDKTQTSEPEDDKTGEDDKTVIPGNSEKEDVTEKHEQTPTQTPEKEPDTLTEQTPEKKPDAQTENKSEEKPEEQSKEEPVIYDDSNATPASNFEYKIDYENSKVVIHGFKGDEKDVVIPNYIEGYPVTNIAGFLSLTAESLIIPENVNQISSNAITAEKLKTVTIKSKAVNVWGWAFDRCLSLESVTFVGNVTVEGITFNKCNNLKEIIFLDDAPVTLSTNYLISGEYYDIITIKYMKNTNGWDDPKWKSFNLAEIK